MNKKTVFGTFGLIAAISIAGFALAQENAPDAPAQGMMGAGQMGGPGMGRGMGQGMGGMPMFMFEQIDVNSDGKITKDEVLAFRQSRIAGLDANKDNKITADELSAQMMQNMAQMVAQRSTQMIARLDVDGDGALSVEELAAGPMMGGGMGEMMFERFDIDGDGAVTKDEAAAAMADRGEPGRGPGGKHGHRGQGWGEWMHGWGDDN
ncbi:EF-hand domain-containing protein [Tabrizicola sp. J26]|uniref:EF-hand domain-containing protein n=1 Tax=Alitabrizicola rongguiensis TaxID=2909234 RepID=UPI001F39D704|nr:EF-hand domain-containing protein [Tabrizicola rongguiensis]MCF1708837.1 EF-hand domain-containing protein [Tabrizicola rongguiensis]